MGISGLMTPECLSREGSPCPESYPDNAILSPSGQLSSQSAPGSPGHPYGLSQPIQRRLLQQVSVVTYGMNIINEPFREGKINFYFIKLTQILFLLI